MGESSGKAEAFLQEAIALGWKAEIATEGGKTTVTASSNNKTLQISWRGGACLNETSYSDNGHIRKLRNAAAARRQLELDSEVVVKPKAELTASKKQPPAKRAKRREPAKEASPKPFKSTPKPPRLLPFDPQTATDEEILRAVVGKRIVWKNRTSGGYDEARVMSNPNQKQLKIEINGRNERCITFASSGSGFRAVRLSAIVSVTSK